MTIPHKLGLKVPPNLNLTTSRNPYVPFCGAITYFYQLFKITSKTADFFSRLGSYTRLLAMSTIATL